ncbi:MAG TPA: hypothetical protein VMS14_00645 [Ilumatobacteraceae bacterium]|nr:hypothetical protein [Ilumatobacteraceae bacterium]
MTSEADELRREALTMALYVSICVLAELIAIDEDVDTFHPLLIVWGTAIGLALAHWLAFDLAGRHTAAGDVGQSHHEMLAAQVAGAALVAGLTSVAIVLFPDSAEYDVARLMLAVFIGTVAYGVSRHGERSVMRSLLYAGWIVAVAIVVASLKNVLGGH